MPTCPKDQLILYDNIGNNNKTLGLFCHLTRPDPIRTTSNRLTVYFMAGSSHGATRHGFRAQYRSIYVAPPTTVAPVPTTSPTTVAPITSTPTPSICGGLLTNSSGTFNTPNWPLTYPLNFNCVWNITLNDANSIIEISFDNDFGLGGKRPECLKDQLILYDYVDNNRNILGLFCHLTRPDPIRTTSNRLTVYFVAGSSHGATRHGFMAQYRSISVAPPTTVAPVITIPTSPTTVAPVTTIPTPPTCGGLMTSSSGTFNTPNWPLTYPLNFNCVWNITLNDAYSIIEISFDNDFGLGGKRPECLKDQLILYDYVDNNRNILGLFCHLTRPDPIRTTSNRLTVYFVAGSSHGATRHGFMAQYRSISVAPPTTVAPVTTIPTSPITVAPVNTIPTPPTCGGLMTSSSGTFNTPNWPLTYPLNFKCEWNIILNNTNNIIEISFKDNFGLGGQMPDCNKDQLILFDGGSINSQALGVFCNLRRPDPITTSSNKLTILFVSRSYHSNTMHGFSAQYRSLSPPNEQQAECGGGPLELKSPNGSLQTLNWPNSPYAINTNCEWDIECPTGAKIDIRFEDNFRVAGRMPNCTRDYLRISGCGETIHGPYCHVTPPEAFMSTCNAVHITFKTGSERGNSRTGFKLNYICKLTTEIPNSTVTPQCGGGNRSLTASRGSIQTLNWPDNPYPINMECSWDINCLSGVEISFENNFKVAGRMPNCTKDQLRISGCDTNYGPFCQILPPSRMNMNCSKINVSFVAGSERGSTRIGFKLNYRCK